MLYRTRLLCLFVFIVVLVNPAHAADDKLPKVQTTALSGGVYMLSGKGGNIGLSTGKSGTLLIDDQYAPMAERIRQAIAEKTPDPVRFVINTHWHRDHTGGNESLGKAGAIIIAHENVRRAMSKDQFLKTFNAHLLASPEIALPVITFADGITFHWNDDTIEVMHMAPAHTDGDSVIYFHNANIIHAGDTFFNKMYPFIDVGNKGSIDGMIAAVEILLSVSNEHTQIIPGHGPLADKKDLQTYMNMLMDMRNRIAGLKRAGKTREEVIAAKPSAAYDEKWGNGVLKPDVWVGIVYDSL